MDNTRSTEGLEPDKVRGMERGKGEQGNFLLNAHLLERLKKAWKGGLIGRTCSHGDLGFHEQANVVE